MQPRPVDERPHSPAAGTDWEESWHFDFVDGDGALGGFVRLVLRPGEDKAWYWAYLAGRGRDLVVVRDHDVELPRGRALEVRATGLWAHMTCETALDHWSAGLEALAVALHDPAEAWRGERGDPVAFGLDMEWEATAAARWLGGTTQPAGYAQPTTVHGDVLLGSDVIAIEGTGWRSHVWGAPPWMQDSWWSVAGHLGDGTTLCAGPGQGTLVETGHWAAGVPLIVAVGDLEVTVTPVAVAAVPLAGTGDAQVGLMRALSALDAGGRRGWGWSEWRHATA